MLTEAKTFEQLAAENQELRRQLAEATEALEAIRRGDVDAPSSTVPLARKFTRSRVRISRIE